MRTGASPREVAVCRPRTEAPGENTCRHLELGLPARRPARARVSGVCAPSLRPSGPLGSGSARAPCDGRAGSARGTGVFGTWPPGALGKEFLRHPARLLPSLCRTRCSLPWAGPVPFCQAWGENRIEMWVSSRLGKEGASPFIVGGEATQDPSGRRGRAESCAFLNRSLF